MKIITMVIFLIFIPSMAVASPVGLCNIMALMGYSVAKDRDNGSSLVAELVTADKILIQNGWDDANLTATNTLITKMYRMGLSPSETETWAYNTCMGVSN